ncbi:hypothetical protein [Flavobacterium sp.]|uniref:hypothetical protein n=1 Tax=Flavobacterium sp. TaxID=239 RepID=UPI0037C02D9E
MAVKKTPKTTGKGKQLRALTDQEYQDLLQQNTERYMQQMKPVILSPEYSTPDICLDFIKMATDGGATRCQIMIKAPVERKGRGGRVSIGKSWMPYEAGKDYSIKSTLI